MPVTFRTSRALSALGSLTRATALVAAFVALPIAARNTALAEVTRPGIPVKSHSPVCAFHFAAQRGTHE